MVTAAITTYNRGIHSIDRAVNSIRSQTYPIDEILIVDDNPMGTIKSETIKAYAIQRNIRYLSRGGNFGVSAARNYAAEHAHGDYIAFLDDDDEWLPDKIEKEMALFDSFPEAGLTFGLSIEHNDVNGVEHDGWQKTIFWEVPTYVDMLTHDHVGSGSNPLIKLKAFEDAGGFRKMPAVEDYDFWIRIAEKYPILGMEDPVFIRHMDTSGHVSTNHHNTSEGYRMIYEFNKKAYDDNPNAKKWIFYNIAREKLKTGDLSGIPYLLGSLGKK